MTARIIIADQQPANRITLKVRLAAACHNIATVSGLRQLLAEVSAQRPDLVILGGAMDGYGLTDLCALLRRTAGATMAILALTPPSLALAAYGAGANATLPPCPDEALLLARVRALLRAPQAVDGEHADTPASAFAPASIALVGDTAGRGLCWKHLLAARLPHRLSIASPAQCLADASQGHAADLYILSVNPQNNGDGLRLLSELRTRVASRDAAFIVAASNSDSDAIAMALDLGAGDVLPPDLGGADLAGMVIGRQLRQKTRCDAERDETRRKVQWAMTDALTGLHNRRFALPRLVELADQSISGGRPLAVIALDVDRFKSVNDRFGHASGDLVLQAIAERLRDVAPANSVLARIGGEEFMLALPDHDLGAGYGIAELLRARVAASPVILPRGAGGGTLPVTLSAGVASLGHADQSTGPRDPALAERLLDAADRALMVAKSSGRNRVVVAPNSYAA